MIWIPLTITCPSCGTKTEYRHFFYSADGEIRFGVWCPICLAERHLDMPSERLIEWASKYELNARQQITPKDELFLKERGIKWDSDG